jgi:hypothetical protein
MKVISLLFLGSLGLHWPDEGRFLTLFLGSLGLQQSDEGRFFTLTVIVKSSPLFAADIAVILTPNLRSNGLFKKTLLIHFSPSQQNPFSLYVILFFFY